MIYPNGRGNGGRHWSLSGYGSGYSNGDEEWARFSDAFGFSNKGYGLRPFPKGNGYNLPDYSRIEKYNLTQHRDYNTKEFCGSSK